MKKKISINLHGIALFVVFLQVSIVGYGLSITVDDITSSGCRVNWTAVAGATDYEVYFFGWDKSTFSYKQIPNTSVKQDWMLNREIATDKIGFFEPFYSTDRKVRVYAVSGTTVLESADFNFDLEYPGPTITGFKNTTTTAFTVCWNNTVEHVIEWEKVDLKVYKIVSGITLVKQFNNLTGTEQQITGLEPGTKYKVSVIGKKNDITSYGTVDTVDTKLDSPVANSALNVNTSSFLARWNAVTNATYYKLYVKNFATGEFIIDGKKLSTTNYTVSGLQAFTKYVYYLFAANSTTNSGLSNVIQVTTTGVPVPVALEPTSVSSSTFQAIWTEVEGATAYRVYYGKVGDTSSENSVETKSTFLHITKLEPYTWYWYRVRAYKGTQQSDRSNQISVRTALSNPVVKEATNVTSTSFTANWEEYKMENVTGYELVVWKTATGGYVAGFDQKIVSDTSIIVTGLTPDTEYSYRIAALFFYGTVKTNYSNIHKVTTKTVTNYSLTLTASPAADGTVSGEGSFVSGTSVTAVAKANSGYRFVNWTENGSQISSSANYTFSISANRTLVANFEEIPPATYTIAVAVIPANSGTATGGGIYNEGSSVTVSATPAEGFSFVNWTDGDTEVSTDEAYTFTATANRSLVANFEQNTATDYTIVVTASPSNMGSVSGGGTYVKGSSVTVTATPASRVYRFVNWTEGGTIVSTDAVYTFTARADRNLVANFEQNTGTSYTIVVTASPSNMGSAGGEGTYAKGSSVTVTAAPMSRVYRFVNWTEGGTIVSTDANYIFTATADRNLVANFEQNAATTYTIAVTASPSNMGSVSGGGSFTEGASVTVTATSMSRVYRFVNWTEGETIVSTDAVYTFTATADRNLVANFEQNTATTYTVDLAVLSANSGTANGGGTFNEGSSVTVSATPAEGFRFVNWTEGDAEVSTDAAYAFTLTADRNLVANFEQDAAQTYTVALEVNGGEGGTVNFSSQSFEMGASVTVIATPDDGYVFAKWMEGSTLISTDYEYTFGMDGDITLTAYFDKKTDSGLAGEIKVRVYPNPALATITVSGLKPESSVKLIDLAGSTVFEKQTNSSEQNIDVGNLCRGFYVIVIEHDAFRLTKKVMLR